MSSKIGQCWTPTSLWRLLQELGTNNYNIIVTKNTVTIKQLK